MFTKQTGVDIVELGDVHFEENINSPFSDYSSQLRKFMKTMKRGSHDSRFCYESHGNVILVDNCADFYQLL